MPHKSMHVCNYPGCQALTRERYCEKHRKASYDDRRQSAAAATRPGAVEGSVD